MKAFTMVLMAVLACVVTMCYSAAVETEKTSSLLQAAEVDSGTDTDDLETAQQFFGGFGGYGGGWGRRGYGGYGGYGRRYGGYGGYGRGFGGGYGGYGGYGWGK